MARELEQFIASPELDNPAWQRIWDLALRYQDTRQDTGHTATVTYYAIALLEMETDTDPRIVVPAAILHDIGWSQLTEQERMGSVDGSLKGAEELAVRIKHQEEGVRLAREILQAVGYDPVLTEQILDIISGHDTRKESPNINDSIMRDADKMWRFSALGVQADLDRRDISTEEWLSKRLDDITNRPGYFFTEVAKELAKRELAQRFQEHQLPVPESLQTYL